MSTSFVQKMVDLAPLRWNIASHSYCTQNPKDRLHSQVASYRSMVNCSNMAYTRIHQKMVFFLYINEPWYPFSEPGQTWISIRPHLYHGKERYLRLNWWIKEDGARYIFWKFHYNCYFSDTPCKMNLQSWNTHSTCILCTQIHHKKEFIQDKSLY